MEGILEEIPGVESASVDFDTKIATVTSASSVTADAIAAAVAESGQYTATPED